MMFTYVQATGKMLQDGALIGTGYSGFAAGKNEPLAQSVPEIGPIPCGMWTIEGPPFTDGKHGPDVLRLQPYSTNVMFGRSGFLIHGDGIVDAGSASHGCIILNRFVRLQMWDSGDRDLEVIAELPGDPDEV